MIEWWSAFVRNVVTVIRLIITSAGNAAQRWSVCFRRRCRRNHWRA
jgi:hypothetical protein